MYNITPQVRAAGSGNGGKMEVKEEEKEEALTEEEEGQPGLQEWDAAF